MTNPLASVMPRFLQGLDSGILCLSLFVGKIVYSIFFSVRWSRRMNAGIV